MKPTSPIISSLILSEELDLLHSSLSALFDMSDEGEIDLILEQSKKSDKQKVLYLEKVIKAVESPALRHLMETELQAGHLEFFSGKYLSDFLHNLQREAERTCVIKLTTAIKFKPQDIRQMTQLLTEKVGRPTVLEIKVEPSLIGGAIVQHGSYISDYSIKTRLGQFRTEWKEAVV